MGSLSCQHSTLPTTIHRRKIYRLNRLNLEWAKLMNKKIFLVNIHRTYCYPFHPSLHSRTRTPLFHFDTRSVHDRAHGAYRSSYTVRGPMLAYLCKGRKHLVRPRSYEPCPPTRQTVGSCSASKCCPTSTCRHTFDSPPANNNRAPKSHPNQPT